MAKARPGDGGACAVCGGEIYLSAPGPLHPNASRGAQWIHVHPERAGSAHAAVPDVGWRIDG